MPNWTRRPPADDDAHGIRLRRTPCGGQILAIVTSHDLIGCNTHFYRNRTVPCEAPDCQACNEGLPWRYHAYLSAVDAKTNEHFLFEMTPAAAEVFSDYFERHETLRGCLFKAHRSSPHPNGRVLISATPADLSTRTLPKEPNITKLLCYVWNVTNDNANNAPSSRRHSRFQIIQPDKNQQPTTPKPT